MRSHAQILNYQNVTSEGANRGVKIRSRWISQYCVLSLRSLACSKFVKVPTAKNVELQISWVADIPEFVQQVKRKVIEMYYAFLWLANNMFFFMAHFLTEEILLLPQSDQWRLLMKQTRFSAKNTTRKPCRGNIAVVVKWLFFCHFCTSRKCP